MKKQRTPYHGEINLEANQTFTAPKTQGFVIYSAFGKIKNTKDIKKVQLEVFEADLGKDQKIIDATLEIRPGQSTEYLIFRGDNVRVKIKVSANKTRY